MVSNTIKKTAATYVSTLLSGLNYNQWLFVSHITCTRNVCFEQYGYHALMAAPHMISTTYWLAENSSARGPTVTTSRKLRNDECRFRHDMTLMGEYTTKQRNRRCLIAGSMPIIFHHYIDTYSLIKVVVKYIPVEITHHRSRILCKHLTKCEEWWKRRGLASQLFTRLFLLASLRKTLSRRSCIIQLCC